MVRVVGFDPPYGGVTAIRIRSTKEAFDPEGVAGRLALPLLFLHHPLNGTSAIREFHLYQV